MRKAARRAPWETRSVGVVVSALAVLTASCGLTDDGGALEGLTGDCRNAVYELERQRTIRVDVTFTGMSGRPVAFTDDPVPPLVAEEVAPPALTPENTSTRPEQAHTMDPAGRWTGPVDYEHSRLSTVLFDEALAARPDAGIARVELTWQHPGQTYDRMTATVDLTTVQASARVEGTELVVDLAAPAPWGPARFAAGAERILVPLVPDTGDPAVARIATPAPGQWTVRIPVTAFTGAVPAPGTQVDVPLVVRATFRPDLALTLEGGGEPLPDYGDTCDRDRRGVPPARHDFDREEALNVYVVANLTIAG